MRYWFCKTINGSFTKANHYHRSLICLQRLALLLTHLFLAYFEFLANCAYYYNRRFIKTKNPDSKKESGFKKGNDLLSHKCSTIGANGLNFSVRNGKR